jgi:hypothetical protein
MKAITIAALGLLVVLPAEAGQRHQVSAASAAKCDNDGHCTTFGASAALIARSRVKVHASAAARTGGKSQSRSIDTSVGTTLATSEESNASRKLDSAVPAPSAQETNDLIKTTKAATAPTAGTGALDANGNKAAGIIVSSKTGARAHVGVAYAARFQAYINDLENNYGARVLFMGGIRPGRCSPASEHPCGKALDVCQLRRGVVDARCNLPSRTVLGEIAAAHGLFEGGRWCHSDYGHAQIDVTAAACGESPIRVVRRMAADGSRP